MSLKTAFLSKTTVRIHEDLKIVLLKYFFPNEKFFVPTKIALILQYLNVLMVSLPELDNRLKFWLEILYGDST